MLEYVTETINGFLFLAAFNNFNGNFCWIMVRFLSLTMTVSVYALLQAHIWPWRTKLSNLMDPWAMQNFQGKSQNPLEHRVVFMEERLYIYIIPIWLETAWCLGHDLGPSVAIKDTHTYIHTHLHIVTCFMGAGRSGCISTCTRKNLKIACSGCLLGPVLDGRDRGWKHVAGIWQLQRSFDVWSCGCFGFEVQRDDVH